MGIRRSHYEIAFEACLNQRGTPFVAIEDVRYSVKGRLGAKVFDYIVYPAGGLPCLIDVKGRKVNSRQSDNRAEADSDLPNWVTRGDLEGLQCWQEAFGADYAAGFVFAYWRVGADGPAGQSSRRREGITVAGRTYTFHLALLAEYREHQRIRSPRWDTINIPANVFRRILQPIEKVWPAAPC